MATIRISEAEAVRDFAALLTRVRAGEEIVIESEAAPVAFLRPQRRCAVPYPSQSPSRRPDQESLAISR